MASTSETGHARNVANLQKLTEQVTVYTLYNPPVDNLKVANLQTLYTTASAKLNEVEDKRNANKNAITVRQSAFENLKSTATKIINHLEILGLPSGTIDQAKSLNRVIQGGQKKAVTALEEGKEETKTVSTSRQSYTQMAENFGILLQLLGTIPTYNPNEDDLKITALQTYQTKLDEKNTDVKTAYVPYNNAMIARDVELYADNTGLVDIALDVKNYVKSVFGANSPQYRQISAIVFSRPSEK